MVERPNFDEIVDEIEKDAERERQVRALVSTPISGEDRKAILDDLDEEIFQETVLSAEVTSGEEESLQQLFDNHSFTVQPSEPEIIVRKTTD